MNVFKKFIFRSYQKVLKSVKPFLPYKDPFLLDENEKMGELLKKNRINKVLLLTDQNLKDIGLTKNIEDSLEDFGIEVTVFSNIKANPCIRNVENAFKAYESVQAQALIAFGGGSVIDCAKATGIKIVKPNKDLSKFQGILKVFKKTPLLIAIPTTAGTGSETTLAAVIVDERTNSKFTINDFFLQPDVAVLDPKNLREIPKNIRAITGMDALTHAVEAFIGNSLDKDSRASAIEAIRIIFNSLEKSYNNPTDSLSDQMLFASFLAGRAFSRSYVGYIHALAHAVGGFYDTAHGLANAVLMPIVLESYRPQVDEKLYELSVLTGLSKKEISVGEGAEIFIKRIKELNKNLNIPNYLKDLRESDIPALATHAIKEANPL